MYINDWANACVNYVHAGTVSTKEILDKGGKQNDTYGITCASLPRPLISILHFRQKESKNKFQCIIRDVNAVITFQCTKNRNMYFVQCRPHGRLKVLSRSRATNQTICKCYESEFPCSPPSCHRRCCLPAFSRHCYQRP